MTDNSRERQPNLGSPLEQPKPHASTGADDASAKPAFMDVNALVARARGEVPDLPPARRPEATRDAPPTDEAPQAPELSLQEKPKPSPAPKAPSGSGRATRLAVLAMFLVLALAAVLLLLPMIVRDRVIATARAAGLEVTIDGVGVGFGGATLRGVGVKATRTPGVTATAQEIHIAGLSAKDARVLGLEARLEGRPADLEIALAALVADLRAQLAGTPSSPHHLSIAGARVVWSGPDGAHAAGGDIGLEIDSRGAGAEDVRGNVGRFELVTTATTLGPWAASFEHAPASSRARVMFDPPVPDGPSALVVWHKAGATEVTLKIPRTSFKNLGIRPTELGIPADDGTDVEAHVTGTVSEAVRSELSFDATLWRLRPKGFSGSIDLHVEGNAGAPPGKPLELEKTHVTLGPFTAGVTGTLTTHDRGVRLDALFKTVPMPCEQLARAEAKKLGPLAANLQAFGQSTGALRVTGAVNASGVVKYDTAEPGAASLTWMAKETCGVSIFGL